MTYPTMTLEEFNELAALCTPKHVSEMSGLSLHTVQCMAHDGDLPTACKVGGKWRFNTQEMGRLFGIITDSSTD